MLFIIGLVLLLPLLLQPTTLVTEPRETTQMMLQTGSEKLMRSCNAGTVCPGPWICSAGAAMLCILHSASISLWSLDFGVPAVRTLQSRCRCGFDSICIHSAENTGNHRYYYREDEHACGIRCLVGLGPCLWGTREVLAPRGRALRGIVQLHHLVRPLAAVRRVLCRPH